MGEKPSPLGEDVSLNFFPEQGFQGSRVLGFPVKVNGIFDKLFVFQGFDHRFQHSLNVPDILNSFNSFNSFNFFNFFNFLTSLTLNYFT